MIPYLCILFVTRYSMAITDTIISDYVTGMGFMHSPGLSYSRIRAYTVKSIFIKLAGMRYSISKLEYCIKPKPSPKPLNRHARPPPRRNRQSRLPPNPCSPSAQPHRHCVCALNLKAPVPPPALAHLRNNHRFRRRQRL